MARAGKGVNAMTVSMIVFVGLWLASTVSLVILYTHQEEIRKDNTALKKRNEQLISNNEAQSIEQAKQAGVGDQTVVGALEAARAQTAEYASGERTDDVAGVKRKRDQLLSTIRSEGLVSDAKAFADLSLADALSRLYSEFQREHGVRTEGDKQIASLRAEVDGLVSTNSRERGDFEQRAQQLSDKLKEIEDSRAQYRKDREQQVAGIENEFKSHREQTDTALTKEREQRAKAEKQRDAIGERLRSQTEKFAELTIAPEELATARKADGLILSAIPGSEIVYIDLGERDHLVLGMQFAVYSAEGGIPSDGRAKAQIEVASIGKNSSECKVLRVSFGSAILEGDHVANPVYDRQAPMKFVVVGDFDLNRDGVVDAGGTSAVEALISNWGGQIHDSLDALTDFVVVGRGPRKPRPAAEVAPAQAEVNASMQRQWDRYNEVVSTARGLSVPILTQETFLSFLGYSDRYVSR